MNRLIPAAVLVILVSLVVLPVAAEDVAFLAQDREFSRISLPGGALIPVDILRLRAQALAFDPKGRLFGASSGHLFTIDPVAGTVGDAIPTALDDTAVFYDLAFDEQGRLWMIARPFSANARRLFEVDLATGEAREIGPLAVALEFLAFHDGQLYGMERNGFCSTNQTLWRVDPSDASLSAETVGLPCSEGIGFDDEGRLWLLHPSSVELHPAQLEQFDRQTGTLIRRLPEFYHFPGGFEIRREGACSPAPDRLCLDVQRFAVEVAWKTSAGAEGVGTVAPFRTDRTGFFWFFSRDNLELMIKVLDGCAINQRYWVFGAASTDVEYTVRVTDTETGDVQEYFNPLGTRAAAITDIDAFASCP